MGLSPNKLPCLFMVMRQRVINELNQASATQTMLAGSILNLTSIIREILCVQRPFFFQAGNYHWTEWAPSLGSISRSSV